MSTSRAIEVKSACDDARDATVVVADRLRRRKGLTDSLSGNEPGERLGRGDAGNPTVSHRGMMGVEMTSTNLWLG